MNKYIFLTLIFYLSACTGMRTIPNTAANSTQQQNAVSTITSLERLYGHGTSPNITNAKQVAVDGNKTIEEWEVRNGNHTTIYVVTLISGYGVGIKQKSDSNK